MNRDKIGWLAWIVVRWIGLDALAEKVQKNQDGIDTLWINNHLPPAVCEVCGGMFVEWAIYRGKSTVETRKSPVRTAFGQTIFYKDQEYIKEHWYCKAHFPQEPGRYS